MIEFLNNTFGIKNEISVPILISLIVFISGGIIRFIIKAIIDYFSRLQIRNSYRNILKEIVQKCKLKAKHTELFYPTLNMAHNDDWPLKFTRIAYLELAFQQNFNSIFNSFRILYKFRCKKKLRQKAFNKTWSVLEMLKFYENRILVDFENLVQKFTKHETAYYSHLEELRKQHDEFFQPFSGEKINIVDFPEKEFDYIKEQNKIWAGWQSTDEVTRRFKSKIFIRLVKPLYELNLKNQSIALTIKQNNILLAAIYEYEEMTKILTVNQRIFYGYFFNYKSSWKILEKCLKIIE